MTREEVMTIIGNLEDKDILFNPCDVQDAKTMAIKALEQEPMREFTEEEAKAYSKALDKMYKPTGFNVFDEPSGDLISRQAVNEIINDIRDCISVEGYCAIFERLKKLPSVKQEPKTDVLDKIRAEIDKRKSTIDKAISEDELKIEGLKEAYTDCLEIIDKYRE